MLEARRDYRSVVDERAAWLKDNPSDWVELAFLVAAAEVYLNDPEYAIAVLRTYLAQPGLTKADLAGAHGDLGKLLVERRDYKEGIAHLKKAAEFMPEVFGDAVSDGLIKASQFQEAATAAKNAVAANPSSASAHIRLGDVLGRIGNLAGQETEYRAAISLAPDEATARFRLAKMRISQGRWGEADAVLQDLLKRDSQELYARLLRAQLFERQGLSQRAATERKEVFDFAERERQRAGKRAKLEGEPSAAGLVAVLAFVEGDWREAIRILEPMLAGLSGAERRLLGEAYLRLGRLVEGIREIEGAFEQDAAVNTAKAHFLAAELFRDTAVPIRARMHYKKAYEMDPQNVTYRIEYERSASTERSHK
jgi:tetratricopeptide (TPR) repeat protein